MKLTQVFNWGCTFGLVCILGPGFSSTGVAEQPKAVSKAEAPADTSSYTKEQLEHARSTIKILDDVYKSIIVLVTDKYVQEEDDFAAGSAAVLLFKQISEGGSHHVRLIDATGDPYEEANVAKNDFEKNGLLELKKGKAQVEEIVTVDGKPALRVLTAVPVVHERCVMCHEHYKKAKPGEPIGALSYTLRIQ